ncbi:MAG: SDR family NAD(P)-dependent oxidoreductase, partial [Pseudonocardia sp.]|nr:SDR family NAD(P)-dependent oxidoreductase [Pseudonocardia sp.]
MGLLDGKVLLVSGGTQGVGAAVARAAVREGAAVTISGRRREVGEKVAADLGVRFVAADVADPEQALASVAAVVAEHGRIDALVNAAGLTDR